MYVRVRNVCKGRVGVGVRVDRVGYEDMCRVGG